MNNVYPHNGPSIPSRPGGRHSHANHLPPSLPCAVQVYTGASRPRATRVTGALVAIQERPPEPAARALSFSGATQPKATMLKHSDPGVRYRITVHSRNAARVELLLADPLRNKRKYGLLSKLIDGLLADYLDRLESKDPSALRRLDDLTSDATEEATQPLNHDK